MPGRTKVTKAISVKFIARKIFLVRGQEVMLDSDLAKMYEVATKVLNQAVRRNLDRCPEDFMFQLTIEEADSLRSQFVTSSVGHGGRRHLPYAFTEHGVAMLSSVLRSKPAVRVNILIIRAFVRLREYLATHKDVARKMADLERIQEKHGAQIQYVYDYIQAALEPPPKRRIGFAVPAK